MSEWKNIIEFGPPTQTQKIVMILKWFNPEFSQTYRKISAGIFQKADDIAGF